METMHQDAHLLKENVEAVGLQPSKLQAAAPGGGTTKAKVTTSKRAFAIHSDTSKMSGGKKGLSDAPPEKRRVLGDISNRHRNHHDGAGDAVAHTNKSLKSIRKSEVRVRKAVVGTKPKSTPVVDTPAPQTQTPQVDEVEDVEYAYGGLSSPAPDAKYLASLRDELMRDLVASGTRSLVDDYEPSDAFGAWDHEDERKLLDSDATPSRWWSQSPTEFADASVSSDPLWDDDDTHAASLLDDVPAPDDFEDPSYDESDDVLDELLNVDVDAAYQ